MNQDILFTVIDKQTGKEPEIETIASTEEWAKRYLNPSEMGWFSVADEGTLFLMDECGNYAFCPAGRFEVIWNKPVD